MNDAAKKPAIDWQAALGEHDRWLRTVVFSRLRDAQAVEDVMQEVALAAVRQAAPITDPTRIAPWLYRLAVRQVLLYRRKLGRQRNLLRRYVEQVEVTNEAAEREARAMAAVGRTSPAGARGARKTSRTGCGNPDAEIHRRLELPTNRDAPGRQPQCGRGAAPPSPQKAPLGVTFAGDGPFMNDFDDIHLDRLVDGELNETEYRELLASLDAKPDGWKRCAHAFLEAQAWGQDLRAIVQEKRQPGKRADQQSASVRPISRMLAPWLWPLAVAASFLGAFALGTRWDSTSSGLQQIAGTSPQLEKARAVEVTPFAPRSSDRENVAFVVHRGDGSTDQFHVPVYGQEHAYSQWAQQARAAVPRDIQRELRKRGYELQRQRDWEPVRLQDGRQAIFPINQLEFTPVSMNAFQ